MGDYVHTDGENLNCEDAYAWFYFEYVYEKVRPGVYMNERLLRRVKLEDLAGDEMETYSDTVKEED